MCLSNTLIIANVDSNSFICLAALHNPKKGVGLSLKSTKNADVSIQAKIKGEGW